MQDGRGIGPKSPVSLSAVFKRMQILIIVKESTQAQKHNWRNSGTGQNLR